MKAYSKIALLPLLAVSMFGLVGCGSNANLAGLDAKLEEIKARPRGRIEPPPEFKPIATYAYSAQQLRSPFSPPKDQELLLVREGVNVEPDLARPKEYLERFSLDALRMVGTITKPGEPVQALIADPSGAVTRVRPGNYMGKNFGRVKDVSEVKVGLIEIVPDGRDGWVERASNVSISE
ncbi:pilus assembly protein PilP [Alcanivorax sp. HI0083]|jgi:type IV pilus assembly protein PilP|nr:MULTISPECIES: pilus assembly protein PilP [unclassified Alcanivorax]KZY30776.1 pilus assembly protein PilP [Alcanivorax sp. HI0044]KZZ26915.1 pilus assembly protein PilP [Alcanivorax sp. HI0083]